MTLTLTVLLICPQIPSRDKQVCTMQPWCQFGHNMANKIYGVHTSQPVMDALVSTGFTNGKKKTLKMPWVRAMEGR